MLVVCASICAVATVLAAAFTPRGAGGPKDAADAQQSVYVG